MNKMIIMVGLFLSLVGGMSACWATQTSDPVNMIKSIAEEMIAQLQNQKVNLQQNSQLVYALTDKIIVPHADMTEMSKRVLPPQVWQHASSGQQKRFQEQFTKMLVRTYAQALASYKDQTLQFYPVRSDDSRQNVVKVDSDITRNDGPPIHVSYQLMREKGGWKLYDLVVEGVSLLESFRSQFADQLAQGSIDDLINTMAKHINNTAQS